jgi:hypothetical protein
MQFAKVISLLTNFFYGPLLPLPVKIRRERRTEDEAATPIPSRSVSTKTCTFTALCPTIFSRGLLLFTQPQ